MSTLRWRLWLGLTAAGLALALSGVGDPAQAAVKTVICRSRIVKEGVVDSDQREILALTDLKNPYHAEYGAWDRWIYDHAVDCHDPRVDDYHGGISPQGDIVLQAYVDSAGAMVPQAAAEERELHSFAGGDLAGTVDPDWTHVLFAAGKLDSRIYGEMQIALLKQRAEYCLPVPAWLAANPPAWSLVLPAQAGVHAGEVIMLGGPGQNQEYEMPLHSIRPGGQAKIWWRYSADGQLLEKSKPDQEWWEFFTANPAVPGKNDTPSNYIVYENDGIITVNDRRTSQPAWRMTFDGTRLEGKLTTPRNHNGWLGFTAYEAKALYAIQHGKRPPPPGHQDPVKPRPAQAPLGGGR